MKSRRSVMSLLLAAAALGVFATAWPGADSASAEPGRDRAARHPHRPWRPTVATSVSVAVEDAGGRPLRTFAHQGRTFVLGERGDRYAINVRNDSSERVEVVVSVDGRDAVSGKVADFEERGYVVAPHGSVTIDGFRTSLDEVAAFRFASPGASYSARMGTPENVGVIGVAVFAEKRQRPVEIAQRSPGGRRAKARSASPPAPESESKASRDEAGNLGTEFGEQRTSRVSQTSFERASRSPARVITLHYDDTRGLEARGIDVFGERGWRRAAADPQPFPGRRFATPPPR